jgi:hypothetical protein
MEDLPTDIDKHPKSKEHSKILSAIKEVLKSMEQKGFVKTGEKTTWFHFEGGADIIFDGEIALIRINLEDCISQ